MMMDYGMGWGWGFGWIGMILFWLVPILLVLVALKYSSTGKSRTGIGVHEGNGKALAILEEKYARGEISREEFLQKLDDLKRRGARSRDRVTQLNR